jgi:hypothetical protein
MGEMFPVLHGILITVAAPGGAGTYGAAS